MKLRLGDHVLVPAAALTFPLRGRVESHGSCGGRRTVTTRVWLDDLPLDAVEVVAAVRCAKCGQPTDEGEE